MKYKVVFDMSWVGMGGIGRFSSELSNRLHYNSTFSLPFIPANAIATILYTVKSISSFNAVIFSPGFVPPLFFGSKFIFVIHDLNHIDIPSNSSILKKFFYNFIIKRNVRNAKKILTVSCFTKEKIISWSGVDAERVVVVGNGVSSAFFSDSLNVGLKKQVLCVSNRKEHKNERRLIKAFSCANIDKNICLLFTGEPTQELQHLINSCNLNGRVRFSGFVSDSSLRSLYSESLALLFPSLYEGFGLPVVEAMACGVPVLTSNTTSLPEVAGDAALLVNPESVDEIRVGIEQLVHDEALRTELIAKGLERAKLFSWDAVAARVQAVLDEVTSQHER
ncbi:glycosyltransferase family 4 protein [Aeromonas veronii]